MAPADDVSETSEDVAWPCNLCADILFNPVTLPCCGESFCRQCLRDWITRRCESSNVVRCPHAGCGKEMSCRLPAVSRMLSDAVEALAPSQMQRRRQEEERELRIGSRVELHGLVGAAHLNGRSGICDAWVEESERWAVRLENGEVKKVKPENLTVRENAGVLRGGFISWQEVVAARDLQIGNSLVVAFGTKGVVISNFGDVRLKVKFDERLHGNGAVNVTLPEIAAQLPEHFGFVIGQRVSAAMDLMVGDQCVMEFASQGTVLGLYGDDRVTVRFDSRPIPLNVTLSEIHHCRPMVGGFRLGQKVRASRDLMSNDTLLVLAGTPGIVKGEYSDSRVTVQFDNRQDGVNLGVNVTPEEISQSPIS